MIEKPSVDSGVVLGLRATSRKRKWFLGVLVGLVLIPVISCGVVLVRIPHQEASLKRRWEQTLMSFEALRARFPNREVNSSARELEEIAAEAGIELAPPNVGGRVRPNPEAVEQLNAEKKAVLACINSLLTRTDDSPVRFALECVAAVQKRQAVLTQAVDVLVRKEVPRWEVNIENGLASTVPNLLGQLQMQRLLIIGAVHFALSSDVQETERWLRASWSLNLDNLDRPELVSGLIGQFSLRYICAVLRLVPTIDRVWEDRITNLSLREKLLVAYETEAYTYMSLKNIDDTAAEGTLFKRFVMSPLYRIAAIHVGEAERQAVEEMSKADIRVFDGEKLFARLFSSIPVWDRFGRIGMPNIYGSWTLCAKRELEVELTQFVLRARRIGRQGKDLPPRFPAVVKELNWISKATEHGVVVHLDQKLPVQGGGVEPPFEWHFKTTSTH